MQVSQNVVRALHSDPTFKPDKDSVVEQLMGQIRNMEDTISSVLVALEYGPDMGTIYRLNQAASTLKISGRKEKVKGKSQETSETTVEPLANLKGVDDPDFAKIIFYLTTKDIKSLRLCSRWMKERVELHFKNFLILTARSEEDILEMKKSHIEPEKLQMVNSWSLTNTGLLHILAKCSATLKDMNLCYTGISGEGLESVPVLKLEKLDLSYCGNLTNTGLLKLLAKCSATLESLILFGTRITGEGLDSVPVLKQLETLNLGECDQLTDTGLLQLLVKSSATLKELYLGNTRISGEGLESVPVLKLEVLDLIHCRYLTNTGLLELLAKCTATLKHLELHGAILISGEGLESIPVLKQLEILNLRCCDQLTNTSQMQLLAKCSATLKSIEVYTGITGEGMESVPVLKQLKTIHLGDCDQLTNTGLLQLLAKCTTTLESINLYRTGISGEDLADWIARHAPGKLRHLDLRNCKNVSAADKERIRTVLPQCEVI